MAVIKSDFQKILPDDVKQFQEMASRYEKLVQEDAVEAFALMKYSWALAQRWSELQATARKLSNLQEANITLTDFKKWCYERYRQCQLVHESCRVIWRAANEEEAYFRRQGVTNASTETTAQKTHTKAIRTKQF